ncbi:hypothetical protein KKF84_17880 [Myxococcota bacterium]|nr:hypothetical protein [Myxococcota bacterium]MBU1537191.1 hypothetical protein [Myxococcota bacterium]
MHRSITDPVGGIGGTHLFSLPVYARVQSVTVAKNHIRVISARHEGERKKPPFTRVRVFSGSTTAGTAVTEKSALLPGDGEVYLISGGFVHLIREKMKPLPGTLLEWKRVKVRFYSSDFAPRGMGVYLTSKKLSDDPAVLNLGIYAEKGRVAVFWKGELNRYDNPTSSVRMRFFDPKTGAALGNEQLFKQVTGSSAMGVPAFFSGKGKTYIVWHDADRIWFSPLTRLGRLTPHRVASRGLLAYFPADFQGLVHAGGDLSLCWLTWGKNRNQVYKKHLRCKRMGPNGEHRGKVHQLTTRKSVPAGHKQFFEQDLELTIADLNLTESAGGTLNVLVSLKDLSERSFFPLGVYAYRLDAKGAPLGTSTRLVRVPRREYLDIHVRSVLGSGKSMHLLLEAWLPSVGSSFYEVPASL